MIIRIFVRIHMIVLILVRIHMIIRISALAAPLVVHSCPGVAGSGYSATTLNIKALLAFGSLCRNIQSFRHYWPSALSAVLLIIDSAQVFRISYTVVVSFLGHARTS